MRIDELKQAAFDAIDSESSSIIALSRYINENPETAYREKKAAAAIAAFLEEKGLSVEPAAGGLETAFIADLRADLSPGFSPNRDSIPAAVIAEYDALEDIGHGCGHNLIAASAAAAAVGVKAAVGEIAPDGGGRPASVPVFRVVGTPAEEVLTEAAGKNRLIEAGVFSNVENCLMFHPWTETGVALKDLGCTSMRIIFSGKPAHAAADPWNGRNALDAAVIFYNSLSMLRQQLPSGMKLHCIIPEGGSLLNIIPQRAAAEVMLRSTELDDLHSMEKRILGCADAAASAAGCELETEVMARVKPILFDDRLFGIVSDNMKLLGEELAQLPIWQASSDFGDLSREVPSLSLLYKTHDRQTCWHSAGAAAGAHTDEANNAMLKASKVLAAAAIDIIFSAALRY